MQPPQEHEITSVDFLGTGASKCPHQGDTSTPLSRPKPGARCKPKCLMKRSLKLVFPPKKLPGNSLPGGQKDFYHPARQELWDEAPGMDTFG